MIRLIKNGVTVFRSEKDAEKLTADGWKKIEQVATKQSTPANADTDKKDGGTGDKKKQ